MSKENDREELIEELKTETEVMEQALDNIWRAIYPTGKSWEWPGQVVLHVRAVLEELGYATKKDIEKKIDERQADK